MRFASASLILLLFAVAAACGDDDASPLDGGGDSGGADRDSGPGGGDAGPGMDAGPPEPCGLTLVDLALEEIANGLDLPVFAAQAPDSTDTLWFVLKGGQVVLWRGGSVLGTPFLDISGTIGPRPGGNDERGLLGLAFHPDYASNGRFFVQYTTTDGSGRDVVAEYARGGSADVADPAEVRRLIDIDTAEGNHNGGHVEFGSDGFLYSGMGDGGGGGDRHGMDGNGQNLDTLLGKILRLDVDNAGGGFAAAGNPFSGGAGREQIWSYGLRNPYRFGFDSATGDLYIGDVGQGSVEEIDYQPASSAGGENWGWRGYEGNSVFDMRVAGLVTTHATPIIDFDHSSDREVVRGACSVTGGTVYRGSAIPELRGTYLYGDFCSRDVGALEVCGGTLDGHERTNLNIPRGVAGFGRDNAGEIYIVIHEDANGSVHRIVRM